VTVFAGAGAVWAAAGDDDPITQTHARGIQTARFSFV